MDRVVEAALEAPSRMWRIWVINAISFGSCDRRNHGGLAWTRHATRGGDNLHQGDLCATKHGGVVTQTIKHVGWTPPSAMDLTREQVAFLAELRAGGCRAVAAQDASVIGPLIRANLVHWQDDPSEAAIRKPPGSTFTLTPLGEACLAEYERQERLPE